MKTLVPFLLVAAATLAGLWISRPPAEGDPPPAAPSSPGLSRAQETGRRLYLRRCVWCHGAQGEGFGLNASRLETPPPDFTTRQFRSSHPKNAILDWLEDRRPRPNPLCPSWQSTLASAEKEAVTQYLLTLAASTDHGEPDDAITSRAGKKE